MNVAILGASNKPERYSHQAVILLAQQGTLFSPFIRPLMKSKAIVFSKSWAMSQSRCIQSRFISPSISAGLADAIVAAKPERVIFNPGTENPALEEQLSQAGIAVVRACTLVLLRTNQFESK